MRDEKASLHTIRVPDEFAATDGHNGFSAAELRVALAATNDVQLTLQDQFEKWEGGGVPPELPAESTRDIDGVKVEIVAKDETGKETSLESFQLKGNPTTLVFDRPITTFLVKTTQSGFDNGESIEQRADAPRQSVRVYSIMLAESS